MKLFCFVVSLFVPLRVWKGSLLPAAISHKLRRLLRQSPRQLFCLQVSVTTNSWEKIFLWAKRRAKKREWCRQDADWVLRRLRNWTRITSRCPPLTQSLPGAVSLAKMGATEKKGQRNAALNTKHLVDLRIPFDDVQIRNN